MTWWRRAELRLGLLSVIVLVCLPCAECSCQQADHGLTEEEMIRLKTIAEGCLHNREAFPFFACRFVIIQGTASSVAEAVEKGPTEGTVEAEGLWMVAGDKERYEINRKVQPEEVKVEKVGEGQEGISLIFPPAKRVGQGSVVLSVDGMLHGGGLYSPDSPPPPVTMTPWDMIGEMGSEGKLNPGWLVTHRLDSENIRFRFGEIREIDGRRLVPIVVEIVGDEAEFTFFVDPSRGFLPIQLWINDVGQPPFRKGFVTHVRECSGGRWFPERVVGTEFGGGDETQRCLARELKVTELNVDSPPGDEDFAIWLAAGMTVHDCIDPYTNRQVKKATRIHVRQLPAFLADIRRVAKIRRQEESARSGKGPLPEPRLVGWWTPVVITLIVCVALAVVWRRRSQRRAPS